MQDGGRSMKNKKYDERQMLARGTAFRWGCLAFILVLIVWALLREFLGITAEPLGELLLLMSVPFAVVLIKCILEEAFDPIGRKPGMVLFVGMPILAVVAIILHVSRRTPLINGKCLTQAAGSLALYAAWIVISIVYWIKYAKDTKEEKENRS